MLYAGIDPGKEGFVCVFDGKAIRSMWRIPYLENDEPDLERVVSAFRALKRRDLEFALLEEQHPFRKQGAVSAGTLMFGYAIMKVSLVWAGISFETVKPEAWKREMGLEAPKLKLPRLPKKPPETDKAAHRVWKREHARIERERARLARVKKTDRKDKARHEAHRLAPLYDFRLDPFNPRTTTPHDGKCEAFLLAVLAHRRRTK